MGQTVGANSIQRLDGSRISTVEAKAFARKTLDAAHVTGAQIGVIDDGRLVWSAAFRQRRVEPSLPMTNSDNGELAFRPLLETVLSATVTPWEWEDYTPESIAANRTQP